MAGAGSNQEVFSGAWGVAAHTDAVEIEDAEVVVGLPQSREGGGFEETEGGMRILRHAHAVEAQRSQRVLCLCTALPRRKTEPFRGLIELGPAETVRSHAQLRVQIPRLRGGQ